MRGAERTKLHMTMTLDGYVAGPNQGAAVRLPGGR